MKLAAGVLIFAVLTSTSALALPCTGASKQIGLLSRYLAHRDIGAANHLLSPLESSHPDCPELVLAAARLATLRGEADKAQSLFAKYLGEAHDSLAGKAYLARFLVGQGSYGQAYSLSSSVLEIDPTQAAALAVHGQLLVMKGETMAGLDELNRAAKLDPEDAETQFQLGAAYDQANRPKDVIEHMEATVRLDPADPSAWDYLALNLETAGEAELVEDAYKHGLLVNVGGPHFDSFLDYNYGRFLAKCGRLAESKTHLDRAVKLQPTVRATWYERAKVDLLLKEYPQARNDAELAASLTDQTGAIADLQIYVLLEKIYQRLGENELARKYSELSRTTLPPHNKDIR